MSSDSIRAVPVCSCTQLWACSRGSFFLDAPYPPIHVPVIVTVNAYNSSGAVLPHHISILQQHAALDNSDVVNVSLLPPILSQSNSCVVYLKLKALPWALAQVQWQRPLLSSTLSASLCTAAVWTTSPQGSCSPAST
eukprot:1158476-Pelagomonas_calceolata.AAC.2